MASKSLRSMSFNSKIHFYSFDLGGMPVDILKTENSDDINLKKLILIIPGNPGIVNYYYTFVKELSKELEGSAAVWAISHSCHSFQSKDGKKDAVDDNRLELEIEHKLRFLEQKVPRDCRVTLIGHSIGCYMILSILEILSGRRTRTTFPQFKPPPAHHPPPRKDELFSQIDRCYFLFPTIERMKSSPNGRMLWPILQFIPWLAIWLVTVISWLPLSLRTKIASLVLSRKGLDPLMIKPTRDLLTPTMFGNMLRLASEELEKVESLHSESVQFLKEKLIFYFGVSDGWCPLTYRNELVEAIPEVINYVDSHNIDHAFVLSHSSAMASVLRRILSTHEVD